MHVQCDKSRMRPSKPILDGWGYEGGGRGEVDGRRVALEG